MDPLVSNREPEQKAVWKQKEELKRSSCGTETIRGSVDAPELSLKLEVYPRFSRHKNVLVNYPWKRMLKLEVNCLSLLFLKSQFGKE